MAHTLTVKRAVPGSRGAAVVGTTYLHDVAVDDARRALGVPSRRVVLAESGVDALSQRSLSGSSNWYVPDGVEKFSARDIPTVSRLLRTDVMTIAGSQWGDPEFAAWWKKSSARKVFDSAKMSTATSRRLLQEWVSDEGRLSPELSDHACSRVDYRPELAVPLARKARPFNGTLTGSDLSLLALDFYAPDFSEAVIQFRSVLALESADAMPSSAVRPALYQTSSLVLLMARMYPFVLRFPQPSAEAARVSRIPLSTLKQYWSVAGRYAPQDVIYRLDLLRFLSEASPCDRSTLVSLVTMW